MYCRVIGNNRESLSSILFIPSIWERNKQMMNNEAVYQGKLLGDNLNCLNGNWLFTREKEQLCSDNQVFSLVYIPY